MPKIVAFLDVLGFSAYTEQDLSGAQLLLCHQEWILRQKIKEGQLYPASSYRDPREKALAEAHLVDSFSHFLPFSDSTFIISESPDKFAMQLSNFLIECLQLLGSTYNDANDPARPEAVEITEFPSRTKHSERWYPPIWRGGLATGDITTFKVTGIENGQLLQIPNLAGTAVVKAVRAEKTGKYRGPRLFCEVGFESNFGADVRPYFRPVTDKISELLWPAFLYSRENPPTEEMNQFYELWHPVVALWKSKQNQSVVEHYDEFLKLLIRSLICWARMAGCETAANALARDSIRADLSDALIDAYLL